ncbi:hypothetical protein EV179_002774 [Coemansia sp. RSA 487]|nr:hypothetical protein EV179_002774 [Coemansia sp. RSA 487]
MSAISIDPHLRRLIEELPANTPDDANLPTPFVFPLDHPISSIGVGKVVASASSRFQTGDHIRAEQFPWEKYAVFSDNAITPIPNSSRPLADYVGVLGMASFTAYLGLVGTGAPTAGETLLVSAASGAVGQIVVQLGKARGLRVIGVVGSDEKAAYVKDIGADSVLNYKTCGDYARAIRMLAPNGVDIYFDNVGGELLDAALLSLNTHARVIICGSMATYSTNKANAPGVKNLDTVITKEVTLKSIYYLPHLGTKIEDEFVQEMSQLVHQDKIRFKVDARDGLESAPQALVDLFTGANFGKLIVKA